MEQVFGEELAGDVEVERTITLPTTPDVAWRYATDGDLLSDWMRGEVTIDARPGGRIEMERRGRAPVWGTVEVVEAPKRIQWSWRTDDGMPSQVEIELAPSDGACVITVRETLLPWRVSGLPPIEGDAQGPVAMARILLAA